MGAISGDRGGRKRRAKSPARAACMTPVIICGASLMNLREDEVNCSVIFKILVLFSWHASLDVSCK